MDTLKALQQAQESVANDSPARRVLVLDRDGEVRFITETAFFAPLRAEMEALKVTEEPIIPDLPDEPEAPDPPKEPETPAEPKPPKEPEAPVPSPVKRVVMSTGKVALKVTALSGRLPALIADQAKWEAMANKHPKVEAMALGKSTEDGEDSLGLRAFRPADIVQTRDRLRGYLLKNPEMARRIARFWLALLKLTVDRTLPHPEGGFCNAYNKAIRRRSDADSVGLRRFVSKLHIKEGKLLDEYAELYNSDYHYMDRMLFAGVAGPDLLFLKDNLALGGEVKKAFAELLEYLVVHFEPRSKMLAKVNYGEKAPAHLATSGLRHIVYKQLNYLKAMLYVTEDPYYADEWKKVAAYYVAEWQRIKLPDGREGLVAPHGVNPLRVAQGANKFHIGWHHSVYLEILGACALWDATTESELKISGYDSLARLADTFYWTLPKYGWGFKESGNRMAGNMGGGGANEGRKNTDKIVQFTDGSKVPGNFNIGPADDADSLISLWRGPTLALAPWSTIPDYESKVNAMRADQVKHQPHRTGLLLAQMLFELKRAGTLPGVK